MRRNVLITGAAGFIGKSLALRLLSTEEYNVIAYDIVNGNYQGTVAASGYGDSFSYICADMLNPFLLDKAVQNCDVVFHLAANPIVALASTDSRIDFEQNLLPTYLLLEAMRKSNSCKKIVFASTSAVYGRPQIIPTPEDYSPLKPISLYGATKLACESLISGYCHMYDMSARIFRLANIIGPASRHGVVYDFICKLITDPKHLEILGNGRQTKSYLYIDDCINAILHLSPLVMERANAEVYNVGSQDAISVLEIANKVTEALSLAGVRFSFIDNFDGAGWKGDVKNYQLDCSILEGLGWQPKLNSREAVSLTADQYAMRSELTKETAMAVSGT